MSLPSCSPLTASMPPVMSDCPLMNLVAEVIEISAPSSRGAAKTGAIMELSTHTSAPLACAISEILRMSVICSRGLVGDSSMTMVVGPESMARFTASRSFMSTLTTSMPTLGTTCARSREVPP